MKQEVILAKEIISPYLADTPLYYAPIISKMTNANVYLKCDHMQPTGAFKVRGAFNKLLTLTPTERQQGVICASSGNHGAAVAYVMRQLNIPGLIVVPENTAIAKIENIRSFDAQLELYSTDCMQAELYAIDYAKQHHMVYVSPYDDSKVIAGQGTLGLEIVKQLAQIDAILVPIGGGGLIAGIGGFIKAVCPRTQIIGCLPQNSPVMYECIKAGKVIQMPTLPTLSDATAGNMVSNAQTFELCQKWVDDYLLASEQQIKNALITLIKSQRYLVEGAAGVAMGALLENAAQFQGKNVVVVLSGANISLDTLKNILS